MIVCDSNVLISALLFPGGVPDKIFQRILARRLDHATSPDILTEIEGVLQRKFPKIKDRVPGFIALIAAVSVLAYPKKRLNIIKNDPADNRILECATAASAQFIVTGDKQHLLPLGNYDGIPIISPREFLVMFHSATTV